MQAMPKFAKNVAAPVRAVRMPAEWEPVSAVLMAMPYAGGEWDYILIRARQTHTEIAAVISQRAQVLMLVAENPSAVRRQLKQAGARLTNIHLFKIPFNDTWARDFGPITVVNDQGKPQLIDFLFNGWGLKFAADQDNQVSRRLWQRGVFAKTPLVTGDMVLEGGSIESDGQGTILTTTACLLSPNRNPHLSQANIQARLKYWLGAKRVLWLEHGQLEGDDTDAHIDTLARFCPNNTIAYVRCDDRRDAHFKSLAAMEAELKKLRGSNGKPYRLIPLPWPRPIFDAQEQRLPATYANFLVVNRAVLTPTYNQPDNDGRALAALSDAFPGYEILGIDCRALIEQHGSLHCVTMQLPWGVLTI